MLKAFRLAYDKNKFILMWRSQHDEDYRIAVTLMRSLVVPVQG